MATPFSRIHVSFRKNHFAERSLVPRPRIGRAERGSLRGVLEVVVWALKQTDGLFSPRTLTPGGQGSDRARPGLARGGGREQ